MGLLILDCVKTADTGLLTMSKCWVAPRFLSSCQQNRRSPS